MTSWRKKVANMAENNVRFGGIKWLYKFSSSLMEFQIGAQFFLLKNFFFSFFYNFRVHFPYEGAMGMKFRGGEWYHGKLV